MEEATWTRPESFDVLESTKENFTAQGALMESVGAFATIRESLDFEYHGCYTETRQRLQDRLITNVIGGGSVKEHPWIVFTAGAMGAGKGHTINWMFEQGLFPLPDFISVDPDKLRKELPEWASYVQSDPETAGDMTHGEAGYLVEIAQEAAFATNKNIWVDGSLRDSGWYSKVFLDIRRRWPNFRIAIIHVFAPTDVIMARAQSRGEKTGRFVPKDKIMQSIEAVPRSVAVLEPLSDFTINVENLGAEPKLHNTSRHDGKREYESYGISELRLGTWDEVAIRFRTNPHMVDPVLIQAVDAKMDRLLGADKMVLFSKTYCTYSDELKMVLESTGFLDYTVVELDAIDDGIALQACLARRTGISTIPQLFKGSRFLGTSETFTSLPTKEAKTSLLVKLTAGDNAEPKPSL